MQLEHLTERVGPQSPPVSQSAEAPLGEWERAILGDELSAQPGLAFQRSQLLGGVLEGNAARALAGQLLVFRRTAGAHAAAVEGDRRGLLPLAAQGPARQQPVRKSRWPHGSCGPARRRACTTRSSSCIPASDSTRPGTTPPRAESRLPRCWAGSCCTTTARCIPRRPSPCGERGCGLGVGGCGLGVGGLFLGTRKPRPVVAVLMAYENVPVPLVRGEIQRQTLPMKCPNCKRQAIGLFRQVPAAGSAAKTTSPPPLPTAPASPSPPESASPLRRRGRGRAWAHRRPPPTEPLRPRRLGSTRRSGSSANPAVAAPTSTSAEDNEISCDRCAATEQCETASGGLASERRHAGDEAGLFVGGN